MAQHISSYLKNAFYDWSCPLSIRSWDTLTYSTYQLNPIDVLLQYQCHDREPAPCSQVYCNLLSSNVVHTVADREVRRKVGLQENAQTSGPRCLNMGLSYPTFEIVIVFPSKYSTTFSRQKRELTKSFDDRFTIKTCEFGVYCIYIYIIYGPYIYMYLGKPRPWPTDSRGSALSRYCHTLAAAHELRISWDHDHSI